jgi:hypothetical protein
MKAIIRKRKSRIIEPVGIKQTRGTKNSCERGSHDEKQDSTKQTQKEDENLTVEEYVIVSNSRNKAMLASGYLPTLACADAQVMHW